MMFRGQSAVPATCGTVLVSALSLLARLHQSSAYTSGCRYGCATAIWTDNSATSSTYIPTPPAVPRLSLALSSMSSSSASSLTNAADAAPVPALHGDNNNDSDLMFGKFRIPAASVFYRSPTKSSAAFVNLRPLVPGHVLIIPVHNRSGKLQDLTDVEYLDLWGTVRIVQSMLQQHYQATGFNVAVQDGWSAGQSVPHVHVHVLPRVDNDIYAGSDAIYKDLEEWAPTTSTRKDSPAMAVPRDDQRRDRTVEEMAQEAATYRLWFEGKTSIKTY